MSDDEYEYDDMDNLMALLDEDEELNPYQDSPSSQTRSRRSSQCRSQRDADGPSGQSSFRGQRPSQSQAGRKAQSQRSPEGCEDTDEAKSKKELLDELKRMREEMKLLQSDSSSGDRSQTSQPRETFSQAISSPIVPKKGLPKSRAPTATVTKPQGGGKLSPGAGLSHAPALSNPANDDRDEAEDQEEEEAGGERQGTPVGQKSALFSKNSRRVAHTPTNAAPRPEKVSPYKCELCKETLDTQDALNVHMFQHRRSPSNICPTCHASFPSRLKLEAHARTHATPGAGPGRGRETAAASAAPEKKRPRRSNEHVETNKHSHIRILNPLVSSARLDGLMEGRKMLRLSILQRYLSTGTNEGDWVTMGVIVNKLPPKTSSKGKRFSIWKLSDLSVDNQMVTLFLFGKAHEDHWKIGQGSAIGLLNASVMPPKDSGQDDGVCLSIDHPEKLLLLGQSKDFGHCRGRRKDGKTCSMVINTALSEFCQYHVQTEYKKHSAKRPDLQSSYGGVQPNAFKKKLGNNIIYGGQAYNPMSASVVSASGSKPGSKAKRKEGGKLSLQSLGVQGAQAVEAEARDKVLTLHGRQNKEDTLVKVSGANKQLQEILSCPTLGSQNLIRHMVKVEEVSKPVSTITAKDLIKQHRETMKARHASRLNGHRPVSASASGSGKVSQVSQASGSFSSASDSENRAPVLGRGLSGDDDAHGGGMLTFDLSGSPDLASSPSPGCLAPKSLVGRGRAAEATRASGGRESAKRRAIALVRAQGRLARPDPNQVAGQSKGPLSPRKREALKRRVEEDLNRSQEEDTDSDTQQPAKRQKKFFLGQEVTMSPEELEAIRTAKSSHSGLLAEVQSEMEERYFQQLEKKERLENQMDSIKEKKCRVVSCKTCQYTWFSPSSLCTAENHPLAKHEATMRYFKCKTCSSRCITFNRIPNKSCRSCGGTSFDQASMLKERKGPVLDSEKLLIRGEERKWVM